MVPQARTTGSGLADDSCPVSDDIIGRLYRASERNVLEIVDQLSPPERGNLALFCYSRSHLREIGLKISATCDLPTLVDAAGQLGNVLFAQSRNRSSAEEEPSPSGRRKISLASLAS
ncbi:MAG TPA: hypothetical protein VHN11_10830 [Xanthobacteraceae bacterium]|jgi:hypothetical protein|nr:hypothetical protein [Xanthobacteraceae bacterium]